MRCHGEEFNGSPPALPLLWICGAPAAGKSTTAWALFQRVAREGVAVAYLDIDQVGMLYPESEVDPERFRLKTEALNALIPNYAASGARALIVSGVLDPETPAGATEHPDAHVTRCLLDTPETTLRRRILERGWDQADADEVVAEAATLRDAGIADASIDTAGASLEEVVDRIRPLLSTLETSVGAAGRPRMRSAAQAGLVAITGTRAVGTSTIGFGLARSSWDRGSMTGFADLDQLSFVRNVEGNGPAATVLGVSNLASLHELFTARGAVRLIASCHLRGSAEHDLVRRVSAGNMVTIVRLRADAETIAAHVRERTSGSEARLAGDDVVGATPEQQAEVVRNALAQQATLDVQADEDILIEVSRRTVDTVLAQTENLLVPADAS